MLRFWTLASLLALALPAAAQDVAASPRSTETALAHVRGEAPALGLAARDVADLAVSSAHQSARSGLTHVYVQQRIGGIDIAETVVTVAVGRDGRVVHAAGDLAAGTASAVRAARLTATAALDRVAALVGEPVPLVTAPQTLPGAQQLTVFGTVAEIGVAARLVYQRTDADGLRLAWEVRLPTRDGHHVWLVRVDAESGAELYRTDMVTHDDFPRDPSAVPSLAPVASRAERAAASIAPSVAPTLLAGSYQVYAMPLESPTWGTPAIPGDARTTVANPDNALASPFGWHDTDGVAGAEFTITRGNNVYAYTDTDGNNVPDAGSSPDGGAGLAFNTTIDLAGGATTYRPAAVVNLFYWSNIIHDVMYQYGFTEAAGNFQTNNYGRGGVAFDDAVYAEAQNSGDCNANFWTPSDSGDDAGTGLGSRPRMQMYTCNPTTVGSPAGPLTDADLDAGVIVHEYGHGISNRLVGGPAAITCLGNDEQMGEGWSDFYGLMLTMDADDTRTTRRPIGNFLLGQPASGAGIRGPGFQPSPGAPYSTDFAVNGATYGSSNSGLSRPHGVGFVWATILWEVTWDLIDAHSFSPDLYNASGTAGNQIMMNLVTEGLKLTPCSPGFVDGRDAILAADAALYPDPAAPGQGLHYATLWNAFARRGLGFSASQGSTGSRSDQTQAFDTPLPAAQATIATTPISILDAPGATRTATVALSNTAAPGSQALNYVAALQNVTFVPVGSPRPAPVPAEAAAPAPSGTLRTHAPATKPAPDAAADAGDATPPALGGGPDAGGYRWDDSAEPGGPAVAFQDIAATGTPVTTWTPTGTFDARDEGYADAALPFSFPFYGALYTSIRLSTNGVLAFVPFTVNTFTTAAIPSTVAPNGLVAPFWEDFDLSQASGGTVYTGTLPDGRFVVQYQGVKLYGSSSSSMTFQVLLSAGGTVEVQYGTLTGQTDEATVGIENAAGTTGTQVVRNASYLASNRALRFRRGRDWVTLAGPSGSLAPGTSGSIGLAFDATGLTEGTYTADLAVTTNDPATASVTIPVALTVGGTGVVAGAAGWRQLAAPAAGVTVDDLAAMNLVQGVPGYYPPPQAQPNLLTGYTGSAWLSAGAGTVLAPGTGFFWYFFDLDLTPGGPSNSAALPTTLATTNAAMTADTPVALHAAGTRQNLLGNPFGVSLDVSGVATWLGAENLGSTVVQMWTPGPGANAGGYETSATRTTLAPWQGFWAEAATAGTLTIPASARTTGGVLQRTGSAPEPLVALELANAAGTHLDRAAVLVLGDGREAGPDRGDAVKLTPMSSTHVLLAFAEAGGAMRALESRPVEPVTLPLAVASVGAGADLVLTWPRVEALPAGWAAVLTDVETGQTVDLAEADRYAFSVVPVVARETGVAPAGVRAEPVAPRFTLAVGPRGVVAAGEAPPAALALEAVRPNPARGSATVAYAVPAASAVRVSVVDLLGREVAVLADGGAAAGRYTTAVPVAGLAPGVYVVRLATGSAVLTQRLVVVR